MSLNKNKEILRALGRTGRTLNLTFDTIFKFVFGSPGSEDLLQAMLNAILGAELNEPIEAMRFMPQEYVSPDPDGKTCRMDVVATDQLGRIFNIEMQRYKDEEYNERLVLYVARLVTYSTSKGNEMVIRKIIGLSFGDRPLPGLEECPAPIVRVYVNTDQKGYLLKGTLPITIHVNLSRIRQIGHEMNVEDFDERMKWCYYVAMEGAMATEEEMEKIKRLVAADPWLERVHERFEQAMANNDEDMMIMLLQEVNSDMKYKGELRTARNDGLREGRQEGLQKGILDGKREMAQAMKGRGVDITLISECSGLSLSEIERL